MIVPSFRTMAVLPVAMLVLAGAAATIESKAVMFGQAGHDQARQTDAGSGILSPVAARPLVTH